MDYMILLYSLFKFLLGLVYALVAIYSGIAIFDMLTKKIKEWEEIKKGNLAVSIYMAAIIFTLSLIIEGSVRTTIASVNTNLSLTILLTLLVFDFIKLILTTIIAVFIIYITLLIIDAITKDLDEFEEINNGNLSVALLVAMVIISVGFIIRATVIDISSNLQLIDILYKVV